MAKVVLWLIALVVAAGAAVGLYDRYMHLRAAEENALRIAAAAMADRASGIAVVEQLLLAERIPFDTYRDLIRGALQGGDADAAFAANRSILRVLGSNDPAAREMRRELPALPVQVNLITAKAGERGRAGADDIARDLSGRANVLVRHVTREDAIKASAVSCSDKALCDSLGGLVVEVLALHDVALSGPPNAVVGGTAIRTIDVLLPMAPATAELGAMHRDAGRADPVPEAGPSDPKPLKPEPKPKPESKPGRG